MATEDQNYSVEQEVVAFFSKTSTTRSVCDQRARDLVGGEVTLIPIQGVCSYTVYAGPDANSVVQFRLKSLALPLATVQLAHSVYGSLAPEVFFEGQIGEDVVDKEALFVYVMPRMRGISQLDFILANGFPEDAPDVCAARLTLITDVARFFALSWKSPLELDHTKSEGLRRSYEKDLQSLLGALPDRFHPAIQHCLEALPSIMALPKVLTHKDFGYANILVDSKTCHLLGVIDWAEAAVEPFGINFYAIETIMGKFHLRKGHIRYIDYELLQNAFWNTLRDECSSWSIDTFEIVRSARILGLLMSWGFTPRIANMPEPRPISNDDSGAYNMLQLDGMLVNPETKIF